MIGSFDSLKWYNLEEVNYRTHRKILVVDGEIGFTGGAGVADHWLGHAQDKDHWRDTQVRMRRSDRPADGRRRSTRTSSRPPARWRRSSTTRAADADDTGHSLVLRSSPTGGSNDLKRLYLLGIAAARRTIDITSPYFITDESSDWSLSDAVEPRRQDPDSRRRGQDRRDAGEVRRPRGLRALLVDGHRDLRIPADDDAHQDDGRGRRVEHVWIGELRQPIARAERRDERRRVATAVWPRRCWRTSSRICASARASSWPAWRQRSLLEKAREKFWTLFRGNFLNADTAGIRGPGSGESQPACGTANRAPRSRIPDRDQVE